MTSRGWASTGKAPFGLERLVASENTPFEMQKIEAQPDGFLITFTEEVAPATAQDHVMLCEDGKSARLYFPDMREGYV